LRQQARAAELLAEQEITTKQGNVAAEKSELMERELAHRLAQLELESESIGFGVRGGTGEELKSEDEDEIMEPNVTGMGMGISPEDVTKMIQEGML
jgi:hypothetical protein